MMLTPHCSTCSCEDPQTTITTNFLAQVLAPAPEGNHVSTGDLWLVYVDWINEPGNMQGTASVSRNILTRSLNALGYRTRLTGQGNKIINMRLTRQPWKTQAPS